MSLISAFTILHGENFVASRDKLHVLLTEAHQRNQVVQRVAAAKISLAELEGYLFSQSLFAEPTLLVLEELHSLPQSARKTELISLLEKWLKQNSAQAGTNHPPTASQPAPTTVILWEKCQLTATMLKKFPGANSQEAKLSKSMWQWLDSLQGSAGQRTTLGTAQQKKMLKLFHETLKQDGDFFALSMLIRQIRMLIQVKDTGTAAGAPFMVAKLKRQAASFTLPTLLKHYQQLLEIDLHSKNSLSALTLTQHLDLFLLKL